MANGWGIDDGGGRFISDVSPKRLRWAALVALLLLVTAACTSAPAEPLAAEETPILQGAGTALDGSEIDLADFQGEDVVLWFWAPW